MITAHSVARDLKALGGSAPLRAAYEASKRSGFHSVLFRPRPNAEALASTKLDLGGQVPSSEAARTRCLEDAASILDKGTRVFGLGYVPTGVHTPWNVDPLTGESWPRLKKWWEIDIRTDNRLSDVKFVWESARHRDLVIVARAAELEPECRWLSGLELMLHTWVEQCPPERGVNWYSSLELALRAIAWAQVLNLVGDRLEPRLRADLDAQLVASARHIMLELPYTVSSMKNNHLLGDGLGLVVLGRLFPQHKASARWQRIGDRLFMKQLERHMRPDGSMIEDSLSYHRFVLEMLIVRVLLGGEDPAVATAMHGAAAHLRTLGALDGEIPQFGDWDEGRVLADSAPAGSVAGSALLGLALAGEAVPAEAFATYDELAWYIPVSTGETVPSDRERVSSGGGFTHVRQGPWHVWFKTGSGPSHQHADVSSVWVRRNDEWLIADPGTGTYNGPLEVRNGFRTSTGHPVWHPEGVDQMDPHRAFRWLRSVRGHTAEPLTTEHKVVLFGWHDAFEGEETATRVARAVVITDDSVVIRDFIENQAPEVRWQLTVPLHPGVESDQVFGLDQAVVVEGQRTPFIGWHSTTYGAWSPSKWLTVEASADALPVWGCGSGDVADLDLTVTWSADAVTLRLGEGEPELRAPHG